MRFPKRDKLGVHHGRFGQSFDIAVCVPPERNGIAMRREGSLLVATVMIHLVNDLREPCGSVMVVGRVLADTPHIAVKADLARLKRGKSS